MGFDSNLLGQEIEAGTTAQLEIPIARLPSGTQINMPIHVLRGVEDGPVLLLTAALHGDETNGTETLRRLIRKGDLMPQRGTVIAIPIVNVYGFLHQTRALPDGKDLNRSFPGSKSGSLARRLAYVLMKEVVVHADHIIDLHTGGAARTNYPQIRCDFQRAESLALAKAFCAPFLIHSPEISSSFRKAASKKGKSIIVFEGGESLRFDEFAIRSAMEGILRVMAHLNMAHKRTEPKPSMELTNKTWVRASVAGLFVPFVEYGGEVRKGQVVAHLCDPTGLNVKEVKSPKDGFILGLTNSPIVHAGDALLHIANQ